MLFQPNDNSSKVNKSQERIVKFVIAHKNSAEPFELLEETFHQMAFLVGVPVHRSGIVDIAFRRNRIGSIM